MCKTSAGSFTAAGHDALRQLAVQRLYKLAQTASDAATTTTPVPKPTSSGDIPAWKKAKQEIRKREAAGVYKRDAAPNPADRTYTSNAWAQAARNAGHAIAGWGTAGLNGLLSIPGALTGLVGGLGNGIYSWATGDGFGKGFGEGFTVGKNLIEDHIGFGQYDLGNLRRTLGAASDMAFKHYLSENNIDPRNAKGLDRAAINAFKFTQGIGQFTGEVIGGNVAMKGIGAVGKGINKGYNMLGAAKGTGVGARLARGTYNTVHGLVNPVTNAYNGTANALGSAGRYVANQFSRIPGVGGAGGAVGTSAADVAAGTANTMANAAMAAGKSPINWGSLARFGGNMAQTHFFAIKPSLAAARDQIYNMSDFINTPTNTKLDPALPIDYTYWAN